MRQTCTLALTFLMSAVLGCGEHAPAAATGPALQDQHSEEPASARVERPGSITGSGHYMIGEELRTFAFHAILEEDGTTKGTFELHNRATGGRLHGRVTCVTIFANNAWFGGIVEGGNLPLGEAIWRVRDNGEGANDPPDQLSGMVITPTPGTAARQCLVRGLMPLNTVERGNIQVRPTADLSGPFTGTWSGVRFTVDGRVCCGFRWDLEQDGNEVSGMLFAPHVGCTNAGGCPVTGSVTGNVLTFTVNISFIPGATNEGTATLDGNTITGTIANCQFGFCEPAVGFRVTRQ